MDKLQYRQYRAELSCDPETGQPVAEVPALLLSDYGENAAQVLES